jgi:hypothetical protein
MACKYGFFQVSVFLDHYGCDNKANEHSFLMIRKDHPVLFWSFLMVLVFRNEVSSSGLSREENDE